MFKRFKIILTGKKVVIIIFFIFLVFPNFALAKTTITKGCEIPQKTSTYKPILINFNLPGITQPYVDTKNKLTANNQQYQVKNLQCFIIGIYVYFSGVAGILATVMIMYGGVKYVISMGNPSRMGDAKDTIFSAVVGLVLVLGAYVLLNLINPNLTSLKVPGLDLPEIQKAEVSQVIRLCGPSDKDAYGDIINCGEKKFLYPDDPDPKKQLYACMGISCNRGLFGKFSFCSLNDKKIVEGDNSLVYTSGKCMSSEIVDASLESDPNSQLYRISASPSDQAIFDLFGKCGDLWAGHSSKLVDWIVSTDCPSNEQCVSYDIPIIPLKSTGILGSNYFAGIKEGVFQCIKVNN